MGFEADVTAFDDGVEQGRLIYCFDQRCSFHWRASCPMPMAQAGPLHGIAPCGTGCSRSRFLLPAALHLALFAKLEIFSFSFSSLCFAPFQTLLLGWVSSRCNAACTRGRFGRKAMLLLSLVCSVVFGMLSAASVSYSMLAITRTLTGVALSGTSLITLPLGKYVGVCGRPVVQGDF